MDATFMQRNDPRKFGQRCVVAADDSFQMGFLNATFNAGDFMDKTKLVLYIVHLFFFVVVNFLRLK